MKHLPISLHVIVEKKDFRDKKTNTLASGRIVNAEPILFLRLDNGEELIMRGASLTQVKKIQEGDQGVITYRSGYTFIDEFVKDEDIVEESNQAMDADEFVEKYPNEGLHLGVTKKDRIIGYVLAASLILLGLGLFTLVAMW